MGTEAAAAPPVPVAWRAPPAALPPVISVELGPIVTKLGATLGGSVPVPRIEALITQLLEQEFSDARVTAFLPIFLYRYALEALQADAANSPSPEP